MLAVVLSIPALFVGATAATWAALDYLNLRPVLSGELMEYAADVEQRLTVMGQAIQTIQNNQLLQDWIFLDAIREKQGLTIEQRIKYCTISKQLGIAGAGCA